MRKRASPRALAHRSYANPRETLEAQGQQIRCDAGADGIVRMKEDGQRAALRLRARLFALWRFSLNFCEKRLCPCITCRAGSRLSTALR
ncbi:hypothetical protein XHC_0857 [Xanthomonas hortorum pv. carotae str. M081]|nr:hypothetical protein XHC_0857 [Xanthomonas hortorum pv. carotae str. M081]